MRRFPLPRTFLAFFALAALVTAVGLPSAAAQDLVTYFNFNDSNTTADAPGIQRDPTIIPSPANPVTGFAFNLGTIVNQAPGDGSGAGQALAVSGGASLVNNGKSFQFSFSTIGFTDLSLSYATKGTSSGFTTQTLAYSVDGVNFTDFGTVSPTATFTRVPFNLSTVDILENQASVTFRFTLTGATNGNGTNTFDNIQVTAAPEPGTWMAAVFAAGGILLTRRRWLRSDRRLAL